MVVIPPGFRLNVHAPVEGKPFRTTLPVGSVQVGWVNNPTIGAGGTALTVSEYVSVACMHGRPRGLFVVNVIRTKSPASPKAGV